VNVEIAPRSLAPHVVEGRLVVGDPLDAPRVTVRTTLAATLALLEARCTLVEAVARGQLDVRGDADALDAAADAFALFLHGLVRAPSSPRLLEALRREAAAAGAPA
jgi:hypothetical protein